MTSIRAQNVNHPEHRENLNEEKYYHIRAAILAALPPADSADGMLFADLEKAVAAYLKANNVPQKLFPKSGSVRWYTKAMQLDLEAKGDIERLSNQSPIRLRKRITE